MNNNTVKFPTPNVTPKPEANAQVAEKINPRQAELNSMLSSGKFIVIDSTGRSIVEGIDNYDYVLNLLSVTHTKMILNIAESMSYSYTAELAEAVSEAVGVDVTKIMDDRRAKAEEEHKKKMAAAIEAASKKKGGK